MAKPTILLIPTDPTSPLLADGPCGARVPRMELCSCGKWYAPSAFVARRKHEAHRTDTPDVVGLVLALDGVPVESACIAVARAVAESCASVPPDRLTDILHAHWWIETEAGDNGEAWIVALWVGVDGVAWRLSYEDPDADMFSEREHDAEVLAHIAAARLNCRVIVLDGGEVRDGR